MISILWWCVALQPVLLLVGGSFSTALTGGGTPLTVEELTADAQVIALGTIVVFKGSWNDARTQITTTVTLEPEEILKGTVAGQRVAFVQSGGQVGSVGSVLADAPSFMQGERVVLFLAPRRDGQLGVIGLSQGKFSLERDATSGSEVAVRRAPGSGTILDRIPVRELRSRVLGFIRR